MNTRCKIRGMITVLTLVIIALSCAHANSVTMYVLCSPAGEVNIRDRPSSKGEYEGYLTLGDTVTVENTKTDNIGREWCFCAGLGVEAGEGWVCAGYLVSDPINAIEYNGIIDASGRVAAYNYIGGERHWLKVGTSITVYATGGEWAFTDYGYVRSEYITQIDK